jgi:hypothetical protein
MSGWLQRAAWAGAAASACFAAGADAQGSIAERLNLDRLQLSALGISAGAAWPSRVESTQAYALHADYGEITPHWRMLLTVTYWGSEFRPEVVRELEEAWRRALIDPSGDDSLVVGKVRISDIAFEVDARWIPYRTGVLRPFIGAGAGVHVLNAENRVIANTFVESALDMIASGVTVLGGVDTAPLAGLSFGVQGRYTFISNTRFFTVRAGVSYAFRVPKVES